MLRAIFLQVEEKVVASLAVGIRKKLSFDAAFHDAEVSTQVQETAWWFSFH